MTSPIFADAAARWREVRDAHRALVETMFVAAEAECRGNLLNRRGRDAGIDPFTLFYGTEARAYAYASDELIEFWQSHPRLPLVEFERQAAAGQYVSCPSCGEAVAA
ncbi:hypothetical protein [Aeromicrobium sp. Leaf291]|uniref:hypothetical protein n=1 Tax=Aeromicrobium sp. Leaf291 TaxID=1736325 RepID=UPI0006F62C68|nr:hypothetical protein [Aeromicrobium sp. Leaf291]KQP81556.1 hypothetical protein ASF35_16120 [Aeromicrobium sp. Leaf291]